MYNEILWDSKGKSCFKQFFRNKLKRVLQCNGRVDEKGYNRVDFRHFSKRIIFFRIHLRDRGIVRPLKLVIKFQRRNWSPRWVSFIWRLRSKINNFKIRFKRLISKANKEVSWPSGTAIIIILAAKLKRLYKVRQKISSSSLVVIKPRINKVTAITIFLRA